MSDEKFDPFLLCGPGDRKKKTREPKADPKEKELNDDLNRLKRWAAKKLSICEEIEFEDREDALFNKGYMNALEDMIMEIEMHLPK